MPIRTFTFSTAAPFANNDSMIFTTPPSAVPRSAFDKNNNMSGSQKSDDQVSEKVDSVIDSGTRSPFADSICDDCAATRAGLILRWCETCSVATCDACILDRHIGGHSVIWYQEALRIANRKLGDVVHSAKCDMKQFSVKRGKSRRFHQEVVTKIDEVKRKIEQRVSEIDDVVKGMDHQLQELTKLTDMQLNSKTWIIRRHAIGTAKGTVGDYTNRQMQAVDQLKRIFDVITGMYDNIGQGRRNVGEESLYEEMEPNML